MQFADPSTTTPEDIATALDAAGWITYADPSAETAESIADDLDAGGFWTSDNAAAETGESLALILNALPDRPLLVAESTGAVSVRVSWGQVALATGYRVYRDESSPATTLRATAGDTPSVIDLGTEDTPYYYRVRAFNDLGAGPFSREQVAAPSALADLDTSSGALRAWRAW